MEASQQTQREPEEEPEEELPGPPDDEDETADGQVLLPLQPAGAELIPDLPAPLEMPTMEAYNNRWAEKLRYHSRKSEGQFSSMNLVPEPVPQLWNDCRFLTFVSERWAFLA